MLWAVSTVILYKLTSGRVFANPRGCKPANRSAIHAARARQAIRQ